MERKEAIELVKGWRAEGKSYKDIETSLAKAGFVSKRTKKALSQMAIRYMVSDAEGTPTSTEASPDPFRVVDLKDAIKIVAGIPEFSSATKLRLIAALAEGNPTVEIDLNDLRSLTKLPAVEHVSA